MYRRGKQDTIGKQETWQEVGIDANPSFFFVVVIKPEKPYFTSRPGLEVNPLGIYPLVLRSSSCCPTKGTPPPGGTLQ